MLLQLLTGCALREFSRIHHLPVRVRESTIYILTLARAANRYLSGDTYSDNREPNMRKAIIASAAMLMLGATLAAAPMEPNAEAEPGSARNKPSGSEPVSGGGAKERARRLARMSQQLS